MAPAESDSANRTRGDPWTSTSAPRTRRFATRCAASWREQLPADIRRKVLDAQRLEREDYLRWQRILHAHGWGAPGWPGEYGGTGWSAGAAPSVRRRVLRRRRAAADRLRPDDGRAGDHASSARRSSRSASCRASSRRHDWWCQGYSEPGAGSDLASLQDARRARRRPLHRQRPEDLDHARRSTPTGSSAWCAPTPTRRKQEGISFLLIDMKTPGITVRPIDR